MSKGLKVSLLIVGAVVILAGLVFAGTKVEASRPDDVSREVWYDTKEAYEVIVQMVEDTRKGAKVDEAQEMDRVSKMRKYIIKYVDSNFDGTPKEEEMTMTVNFMYTNALTWSVEYMNKEHGEKYDEQELNKAWENYVNLKGQLEDELFLINLP